MRAGNNRWWLAVHHSSCSQAGAKWRLVAFPSTGYPNYAVTCGRRLQMYHDCTNYHTAQRLLAWKNSYRKPSWLRRLYARMGGHCLMWTRAPIVFAKRPNLPRR